MLYANMPSFEDPEGLEVPSALPCVIDTHVHVFPFAMFTAVWRWFDDNAWRIRYRMHSSQVIHFLLSRGIRHIVALQYAHKPGIARELNLYMAEQCRAYPGRVTGLATVYPGEQDATDILQEAFTMGLQGLKLHAHVQCFDMNSEHMQPLYECCHVNNRPVVMHVGREPKSAAYRCDPHQLCSTHKLERVVREFPALKVCVPHLGLDETSAYRRLLDRYDNLWLDTTMALAGYFPLAEGVDLSGYRADRIMYGSDYPNIPYAWDRELKVLARENLTAETLARVSWKNAADFFGIAPPSGDHCSTGEPGLVPAWWGMTSP